jgi:hypothetical protein
MKSTFLNSILLCCICLCLTNCNNEDEQCNELDNNLIFGEWQGIVNQTTTKNGSITQQRDNDALLILDTDYSGQLQEFIKLPPPFVSEGYVDTFYTDFTFSYLPEVRILELVILEENRDDTLQLDITQTHDVLVHTSDLLETTYFVNIQDTMGNFSRWTISWQMTRKQ